MSSRSWKLSLAAAVLVSAMSANVHAQVCGDADGSGAVTVTDGVQTLRAAAGLDSSCSNATCDVDGSGSVTVTDGVNVLRKAAGLVITEACAGLNGQIQELLNNTVPLFGGLTKIGAGASAAGTGSFCDNAEGSVTFDPDFGEIDFDTCQIAGIEFNGTLGIDETSGLILSFDVDFTDLATDNSFFFFGDLSFRTSGENDVIAGELEVFFDDLGDLIVTFDDVVSNPDGSFISGALQFDAADSDIGGVSAIRVGFTPTTLSPVTVTLTDQTQLDFNFDIANGVLTPAAN